MHKLDKITIQGFKSLKNLEDFEIRPLNILIGANGSGKSNFTSVFNFLKQLVEQNLQLFIAKQGGADTFLHYGYKTTQQIFLQFWFGVNGYQCQLIPAVNDTLIIQTEIVYFHATSRFPQPYNEIVGQAINESKLINDKNKVPQKVFNEIKSWSVYHFHDTSESCPIKKLGELNDNLFFRTDAANLAAFLYMLRAVHPLNYKNIVDTIRLIAPFFEDFILRPSPFNSEKIRLEWKERGSDAYFSANMLSDGTLRFMCLVTLLLQPTLPSLLILDEPELGLHPSAIQLLAALLRSASIKTQIIVSTQSVTLVNHFTPEEIIVVEHTNGESVFKRFSDAEIETWLENYSLGELWEKNILGGRP